MAPDDVILNKVETIERCIARVNKFYESHKDQFLENFMVQDAIMLNLQRAVQASIDLGAHLVRKKKLGIPKNSAEAYEILVQKNVISRELADNLISMTGFRNIAVHDYQSLDMKIVQSIIEHHLSDLSDFAKMAVRAT